MRGALAMPVAVLVSFMAGQAAPAAAATHASAPAMPAVAWQAVPVAAPEHGRPAGARTRPPAEDTFFGVATAKANGDICLQLRSAEPGQPVAESYQCYGPRHPDYAMIRTHVGPIKPGEEKVIRPFP